MRAASRRGRRRAGRPRSRACRGSRRRSSRRTRRARAAAPRGVTTGTRGPSGSRARWRSRSATLTSASASRKWLITLTHASFTCTEMPPTIASHQNSPNRIHASRTRSRRRGRSWYAASTVSASGMPIEPGEDAVDLLDRGVVRRHAHELGRAAVRPVAAPEARVGEAHDRAAHDDRDEQHDVERREPAEGTPPTRGARASG